MGCELIAERIGAESLAVRHRRPLAALERRHSLLDDFELASLVGSHHGCDELNTDAFRLVEPREIHPLRPAISECIAIPDHPQDRATEIHLEK